MTDKDHSAKQGLLWLAFLATIGLIALGGLVAFERINSEAATLIGVIVAALAANIKDIVAAIRGYSMSAQLSKVTDQLAQSQPTGGEPQEVKVTNDSTQPVPVADSKD